MSLDQNPPINEPRAPEYSQQERFVPMYNEPAPQPNIQQFDFGVKFRGYQQPAPSIQQQPVQEVSMTQQLQYLTEYNNQLIFHQLQYIITQFDPFQESIVQTKLTECKQLWNIGDAIGCSKLLNVIFPFFYHRKSFFLKK